MAEDPEKKEKAKPEDDSRADEEMEVLDEGDDEGASVEQRCCPASYAAYRS
jgi:hypothetical protein